MTHSLSGQCNFVTLASKPNLVVNGDFSAGNTGFTSDYTYYTLNPIIESKYVITTDASLVHFGFAGTDHTTGTGNFMVLNGGTAAADVWKESVSVTPNTNYNFSAWFKNIVLKPTYAGLPIASVELWINNVKVSSTLPLPDYPDVWNSLNSNWNSGLATTANLVIKNLGTSGNGNDFAIDDVSFKPCCYQTSKTALQICKGDSILLNGSAVAPYLWTPTTGLSNALSMKPKASPVVTTNYILHGSITATCDTYDTFQVVVTNSSINLGPDVTICEGDSFVFSNSATGTYNWSPIYAIDNNTIPNPTVHPLVSTQYRVKVTNGSCAAYDTIQINVINVNANAGADQQICIGDSVQLTGTATGTFSWSPASSLSNANILNPFAKPVVSTSYILRSSASTCVRTDTVVVKVITSVAANAGNDTSVCMGTSFQLQGSGGTTRTWLTTYALSDPLLSNPVAKPIKDTSYVLETKSGNCFGYDTVQIHVLPIPSVQAGADQQICFNAVTSFTGAAPKSDTVWWVPSSGFVQSTVLNPSVKANAGGQYILFVRYQGCVNSDTLILKVNPKVTAIFKANPSIGIAPDSIHFTNTSNNAAYYSWTFGDTSIGSSQFEPSHYYHNLGNYTVQLIAKDSLGCSDSTSQNVQLILQPYLFPPNAFTANGDLKNDQFVIVYNPEAFAFLKYVIYDRWGEKLYETTFPGGAWWDGTFENKPCPAGVYAFLLQAKTLTGKIYEHHGTVTLLR